MQYKRQGESFIMPLSQKTFDRMKEAEDILKIVDQWKDYPTTLYNHIQEYYYKKTKEKEGSL